MNNSFLSPTAHHSDFVIAFAVPIGLAGGQPRLRLGEKRGSSFSSMPHKAKSVRVVVSRGWLSFLARPIRLPHGKPFLHANTGRWPSKRDSHTSTP